MNGMKRRVLVLLLAMASIVFFATSRVSAQDTVRVEPVATESAEQMVEPVIQTNLEEASPGEFQVGTVLEVLKEESFEADGETYYIQTLLVKNKETGETSEVTVGNDFQPIVAEQRFKPGDSVILTAQTDYEGNEFTVLVDLYRIPVLLFLAVGFFLLVAAVGGFRGVLSIAGMVATFFILGLYMLPTILQGGDPVVVSVIASIAAGAVTIYLAHGFNRKSHVAFGSISAVLVVVIFLSAVTVQLARLLGLGDEQAYFLRFAEYGSINLQGLFLAGIIIGALGVLDDIVIAQVSVVEQLMGANSKLSKQEYYFRALEVGKDHVASLVNTLIMAYAGTSLPLFLLVLVDTGIPWWVKINDLVIAEEIVRTLAGSIGLVLAVPLTTLLAVHLLSASDGDKGKRKTVFVHVHHH